MPIAPSTQPAITELQQSIFNAPPSSATVGALPPPSLPKPPEFHANGGDTEREEPHGTKRGRDEESDDEGAPMEEDDSDAPMEASSDED